MWAKKKQRIFPGKTHAVRENSEKPITVLIFDDIDAQAKMNEMLTER